MLYFRSRKNATLVKLAPPVRSALCSICAAALFLVRSAHAVILFSTADPAANTTEPGGNLAGSGWQYEGDWGQFLGTPIAPHFFISAAHIFRAADVFTFQSATYTIVRSSNVPGTDFLI